MVDRDRSDAPTAVERPRADASVPSTVPDGGPRETPTTSTTTSGSAFDPPDERFAARAELGRGGMGRVEEAYDRALGRAVAIKHMLHPTGTELARFEREVRITARLEHPGIVPIHDAGRTADGTPYYVMRRVDGRPLSEIAENKTLDERLALVPNLLAACDAAAFAHARGVVHRDIKPTNILIGPFGETLLIDWGLAREIVGSPTPEAAIVPSEPDLTRAGTVAGTPGFMSPEQARGETVDARADVFALGITLFYMLTGKLPWPSSSATELVNAVGAGRAPAWQLLPKEVPVDLRAVLEKAMAPEPENRYADAGALAADLRRYITGNLVGAYEYGTIARLVRFVRRHRAAVAVALISLLVVAVVAAISVRRVIAERDDAHAARALAERREREAADVADSLLVDSARQLADTNPIAAIAKLRRLSPTSKRWPEAWAAATTAWFNGIPFGFVNEPGPATVKIAGDSRTAFVANSATAQLKVIDLVTRTQRVVTSLKRFYACVWFEAARSVACAYSDSIAIVDIATGKTQEVPFQTQTMTSDRRSRLLALGEDGRVVELRAGSRELVEIARDVTHLAASPDLEWLVLERGNHSELRHATGTWSIPHESSRQVTAVRDGTVSILEEDVFRVYAVVEGRLVLRQREVLQELPLAIAMSEGGSFVITASGIRFMDERGVGRLRQFSIRNLFHTHEGFIVAGVDGELLVRDNEGYFELGKRPLSYRVVDQSADRRFVVAAADGGDLLVWDLDGPRGRSVTIPSSTTPLQITSTHLWTAIEGEALRRTSLVDGSEDHVTRSTAVMTRYLFDRDLRWIALIDPQGGTRIYEPGRQKMFDVPRGATQAASDDDGIAYAIDRIVYRWRPGSDTPAEIAQLPAAPDYIASSPLFLLAVVGKREVQRLDLATRALERTTIEGDVERIVIEHDGRAWMLSRGVVWRWERGATPVTVPTPEPIQELIPLARGVLLHSTKSLAFQDGDQQRLVAAESVIFRQMKDDLLAVQTSTSVVSVIDLRTARSVKLPLRAMSPFSLVAHGTRLGVHTSARLSGGWRFTYWDLTVPREPEALQKWLTTITNATPIADSDAVAWPKN